MKSFFLILLSLFGTVAYVQAQKIEIFDNSNSGLPENSLNHIIVDEHGNKWIGTSHSGLVKYNAMGFTVYSISNSPLNNQYDEPVCADSKGNIWVTEGRRLLEYDGSKWTVYDNSTFKGLANEVLSVKEGYDGKLYFATTDGIVKYDGSKWDMIDLPGGAIYVNNISTIDIDKAGSIAAGSNNCLLLYDGKQWQKLNEQNSELQLGTVRAVRFMDDGSLYIGYGGGLGGGGFSILKGNKWTHYNKFNSKLPDQMVRDIEVSNGGKVKWMATNDGLARMEDNTIEAMKFWPGRYHNTIMGIAVENNNTIWVTTTTGLVKITY